MRTILVTGGAGFIGCNFVRYWYDKYPDYKIIVLDNLTYAGRLQNIPICIHEDNDRFEFVMGSVLSIEVVNSLVKVADIVIHFAAESHVTRSMYESRNFYETDVLGTHTIANAVLKNIDTVERFVHISTSEVYGTSEYEPMDEDHPLNPCSPYASAKCGADRLVYSYIKTYEIPAVIVRPFNQYGPYQHLEKVVPRFITSAIKDEPLTIHGNGGAERDWLFVTDTCAKIDAVISAPLDTVYGEVFNLGSGETMSVIELANTILREMGKPKELLCHIADRPGQVDRHISSTDKAEKILNAQPGRPLIEGLRQTIAWYQANPKWWKESEWMKYVKIRTQSGERVLH